MKSKSMDYEGPVFFWQRVSVGISATKTGTPFQPPINVLTRRKDVGGSSGEDLIWYPKAK